VSLSGTAVDYPVTGLSNGDQYGFTLVATNAVGSSGVSPQVTAIPLGAPDQMNPPGLTFGDHQVALTWSAPGLNGSGDITTYTIYYTPAGGSQQSKVVNIDPQNPPASLGTTIARSSP